MFDPRDMQLLQETLIRYDRLVNRSYLYGLSELSLFSSIPCSLPIKLLQLSPFPASTSPQYFAYILNALNSLNQIIGYIICSTPQNYLIYIGIKGNSCSGMTTELLKAGLLQVFPDLSIEPVEDSPSFLAQLFSPSSYTMLSTAVSIPPSSSSSDETAFLKTFFNLMGSSQPFVTFFLAAPYNRCDFRKYQEELCEMYHILSMFSQASHNINNGLAKNASLTITNSSNELQGRTNNITLGGSQSDNAGGYTNLSGSTPFSYGENKSLNMTLLQNCARAHVDGTNHSESNGSSHTHSDTHTHAKLSATNRTENRAVTFSIQDKCVQNALDAISAQISRLQSLSVAAYFNFNVFFLSASSETSLRAAYNFSGLCRSLSSVSSIDAVSFWSNAHPQYINLLNTLQNFDTPVFCCQENCYSPSVLISGAELATCFYTS